MCRFDSLPSGRTPNPRGKGCFATFAATRYRAGPISPSCGGTCTRRPARRPPRRPPPIRRRAAPPCIARSRRRVPSPSCRRPRR
ncbi:MAG: hypothetical protein FJ224_11315 [Lentisphaerae bacterium]|nr:hypothetical protein [Lentisphaerota bacterium]